MQFDEWMIGGRIAAHRARRGLTQEELAGLVGISLSLMKKIESGQRLVTRFGQLVLFAQALRIDDLRELTGVPLPLMPDGRRGHPAAVAVRSALLERSRPNVEPLALPALAARIERTWHAWQSPSSFRYEQVGQELPYLLRQMRLALAAGENGGRRSALAEASKLYQLVRTWTKRVGEHELSLVAADRAVTTAVEADDPDLAAAASWNLAMILSARGYIDQARAICADAIGELRPRMAAADRQRLAVWGGLQLLAATEAARADDVDEAHRFLHAAGKVADRTGETNFFRMAFGPTNVACHQVATAVELGRTRDALAVAERVSVAGAPAVERRLTFHLDAARCYVRAGNDIAAVHMMQRIHKESPEELRYSSVARETLRLLVRRAKPSLLVDVRPLAEAAQIS